MISLGDVEVAIPTDPCPLKGSCQDFWWLMLTVTFGFLSLHVLLYLVWYNVQRQRLRAEYTSCRAEIDHHSKVKSLEVGPYK